MGLFKQGRFSEVDFLAELSSGKALVGRLLYPQAGNELALLQGIDCTANALKTLQHPNLPRFDRIAEGTGGTWLLFHHEAGTPLAHWFGVEKSIPDVWIMWWLQELLSALHALHTHDPPFVVGYIEPSDIIIERHRLWLCDLGLLEDVFPELGATLLLRHPFVNFIAPERRVSAQTMPSSDLFSVGAIGFWLATGHAPMVSGGISGDDLAQALREHRPSLLPPVVELLVDLLSCHPRRRPPSAAVALERLAPFVTAMRGEAPPRPPEQIHYKHVAESTRLIEAETEAPPPSPPVPTPIFEEPVPPVHPPGASPWQEFSEDLFWQARQHPAPYVSVVAIMALLGAGLVFLRHAPPPPPPPPLLAVTSGRILTRMPNGTGQFQEAWHSAAGVDAGGQLLAGPQGASLSFGHGVLVLDPQTVMVVASPVEARLSSGRLHAVLGPGDRLSVTAGRGQVDLEGDSEVTLDLATHKLSAQKGTVTLRIGDRVEKVTAGTAVSWR
jgi:serine/threonine protein kinase